MALNFLDELDITSTGDNVLEGFDKVQDNFEFLDDIFHGYANRGKFRWKDADEIYIGPGVYHCEGTTNQILYWNTELTFQLGSGGTNGDSDNLGASEWHYIYIDDSAVVTAGAKLLTNTEFVNDTTAPTWSASKHGWYNGSDRCIFAVYSDSGSNVEEFQHSGNYVMIDGSKLAYTGEPDTTPTDADLGIPVFSTLAQITCNISYVDANTLVYFRTKGATATFRGPGVYTTDQIQYLCLDMVTDSSGIIQCYLFPSTAATTISVYTAGWYFPEGM